MAPYEDDAACEHFYKEKWMNDTSNADSKTISHPLPRIQLLLNQIESR